MSPNFKAFLAGFVGTVLLVAGCEAFAQVRDVLGREQVPTIVAHPDGTLRMGIITLPQAPEGMMPYVCFARAGDQKALCFIVNTSTQAVSQAVVELAPVI